MAGEARRTADRTAPKIGAKIRRLRRDKGFSQGALAERLGVSASYLNLIEHNRRRVTVNLLLQLADLFEIAPAELAEDDESQLTADVMEVLSNDLFDDLDLTNTDVQELVTASPNGAKALLKLFDAYHAAHNNLRSLSAEIADVGPPEVAGALPPAEGVSDFLQDNSNYFQALEDAAARVAGPVAGAGQEAANRDALIRYLRDAYGVRVALPCTHTQDGRISFRHRP